jgi:hypothetical protein
MVNEKEMHHTKKMMEIKPSYRLKNGIIYGMLILSFLVIMYINLCIEKKGSTRNIIKHGSKPSNG